MVLARMLARTLATMLLAVVGTLVPRAHAQSTDPADAVLAERFAQIAKASLAVQQVLPVHLRQSQGLLRAAARLDPDEPRFLRLLAEASLQLGDAEQAIEAYGAYLRTPGGANDQVAMTQLLDLHAARMQTADARLGYLKSLIEQDRLAAEVRSHAAMSAAKVLEERGQAHEVDAMVDTALRLNPLNPEAVRWRWQRSVQGGTSVQRVEALVGAVRVDPTQPTALGALATELAEAGLVDQSITWFAASFDVAARAGQQLSPIDYALYAAELYLADQTKAAGAAVDQLLQSNPINVDAALLRLLVERRAGSREAQDKARADAFAAAAGRLRSIQAELQGKPPTTQPSGETMAGLLPDVRADLQKLKSDAGIDPALHDAYVSALIDLAWIEIYFNERPGDAAPLVEALRSLLPEGNISVARLEGWSFLLDGKKDEARVKLSGIAGRDPLARLGMIRLADSDAAAQEQATEQARQLVAANASGVVGAMLLDALRGRVDRVQPGPDADAIRSLLDSLPRDWLSIVNEPQRFYKLTALPARVSHGFGEPMLAIVSIENVSDVDIPIGPGAVLRPDLWFDAQVRNPTPQNLVGVAYDRIGQGLVLKPRRPIRQTVRVDEGQLSALLSGNPVPAIPIFFSVFTNPATIGGGIGPGPAGYRVQFGNIVERTASPIATDQMQQNLLVRLLSGTPAEKVRTLELLGTLVRLFRGEQGNEQTRAKATEFVEAITRAAGDASQTVSGWARFVLARVSDPPRAGELAQAMVRSQDWRQRLLGLMALPASDLKPLAAPLAENDPEPLVRDYARVVLDLAELPAATQPATAPTTVPTTVPAQP